MVQDGEKWRKAISDKLEEVPRKQRLFSQPANTVQLQLPESVDKIDPVDCTTKLHRKHTSFYIAPGLPHVPSLGGLAPKPNP